ncbi:hypothetical protein SESBI_25807 [Sesbania bispinosa]|nr:hypothetical protein SESBI_25807 [Sesbania bispinosa]
MSGGGGSLSIGIRSGSYGSLDKQQQNGASPIQTTGTARKTSKMLKEKERLFLWMCKFAGRKKVGMLFLCLISAAVFFWVLYVAKGEDSQEGNTVQSINVNQRHPCNSFTLPPPPADKKRTGPRPCPVCYLPVEEAIARMPTFPSPSPVLENLTYIYEENLSRDGEFGGSEFGGYPTLKQRNDSFDIRESMSVHCGFVRGIKPGRNTGFDIDEADLLEMEQCNGVVVASAIFDEETEKYLRSSGKLGIDKKIGLWRIIISHNLPYTDARRTGKIPKLLLHRMVPNARYSIWVDGKLELVVDPYQILERLKQIKLLQNVPEGCVIVREHVPISNLFTCLWFNEVDRFTSRDQISFSTVRDKILSRVDFHFNMFLDCERRNFVIQKYHRDLLLHLAPPVAIAQIPPPSPPPPLPVLETSPEKVVTSPVRRGPGRRGRDRRSGSRRHRKVVAGSRDIEAS